MAELRQELQQHQLDDSGKKDELVHRLLEHLNSHAANEKIAAVPRDAPASSPAATSSSVSGSAAGTAEAPAAPAPAAGHGVSSSGAGPKDDDGNSESRNRAASTIRKHVLERDRPRTASTPTPEAVAPGSRNNSHVPTQPHQEYSSDSGPSNRSHPAPGTATDPGLPALLAALPPFPAMYRGGSFAVSERMSVRKAREYLSDNPMESVLTFLGTASSMAGLRQRCTPCMAFLRGKDVWLFDVGESATSATCEAGTTLSPDWSACRLVWGGGSGTFALLIVHWASFHGP